MLSRNNIEDDGEHQSSYREYCLSLGEDIEEKLPFQKFKNGEGVLVFYVMGHMFSFHGWCQRGWWQRPRNNKLKQRRNNHVQFEL